jgi:hypothetical protein
MHKSEDGPERHYLNTLPVTCEGDKFFSQAEIPKCRMQFELGKKLAAAREATNKVAPFKKKSYGKAQLRTKTKKTVRFAKCNRTVAIQRNYRNDEEKRNLWYQPSEYAEIDQEVVQSIQALAIVHGDFANLDHNRYCLRGLEMKTSKRITQLRHLRACISVRAVLDQQQAQRRNGVSDPDMLGDVSRKFTEHAQIRAWDLGTFDSIDCQRRR